MCVDSKRCQRTRLKKIWTDSEKKWTLFNIHTSDKLVSSLSLSQYFHFVKICWTILEKDAIQIIRYYYYLFLLYI